MVEQRRFRSDGESSGARRWRHVKRARHSKNRSCIGFFVILAETKACNVFQRRGFGLLQFFEELLTPATGPRPQNLAQVDRAPRGARRCRADVCASTANLAHTDQAPRDEPDFSSSWPEIWS